MSDRIAPWAIEPTEFTEGKQTRLMGLCALKTLQRSPRQALAETAENGRNLTTNQPAKLQL